MKVALPEAAFREFAHEDCGATLWERTPDGGFVCLVKQIYNAAIRRTKARSHPDTWDEQW
jgi:hypothetical protein